MARKKSTESENTFEQDEDLGDDSRDDAPEIESPRDPLLDKQMHARRRLEILREERELQHYMEDWL